MPVRSNGNGEFIVKKWAALVGLVVLLLSLGYSFTMTFEIGPIKERLTKVEEIEALNRITCLRMEVHFEYIRAELENINKRLVK